MLARLEVMVVALLQHLLRHPSVQPVALHRLLRQLHRLMVLVVLQRLPHLVIVALRPLLYRLLRAAMTALRRLS